MVPEIVEPEIDGNHGTDPFPGRDLPRSHDPIEVCTLVRQSLSGGIQR